MLTTDEARQRILAAAQVMGSERVALSAAQGRAIAHDVASTMAHPAFDNSAMDGYAVRFADVAQVVPGSSVSLPLSQHIPAGVMPEPLAPGTAARIMTGARMPVGADTVVMREDTDETSDDRVTFNALPDRGQGAHIRREGENLSVGETVLRAGVPLRGGEIGLLAMMGKSIVTVRRRPVVAIISTGDELVEIHEVPGPGQIRGSSSYMLAALIEEAGGVPLTMPIAADTVEATHHVFGMAIDAADIVISIGGVSVGDYDVVKDVIGELCGELDFWKIKMKPGKPLAYGVVEGKGTPLIGLPGNPVSSWVSFYQFVRPLIRKRLGMADLLLPVVEARLTTALRSTPKRLDFQRGTLTYGVDGPEFTPYRGQGSGNPLSVVGMAGMAGVPIGVSAMAAGDTVRVELLP